MINWKPDWSLAKEKTLGDSITCIYIPLNGDVINSRTGKFKYQVKTLNMEKYLVYVLKKDSSTFKLASYSYNPSSTKQSVSIGKAIVKGYVDHTIPFASFSGRLRLKDLKDSKTSVVDYLNGSPVLQSRSLRAHTTNAYEERNCRYFVTCTWITEENPQCGGGYYGSTNGNEDCYEPVNTIMGCYYYWTLISSFYEKQCDKFWVPDLPGNDDGSGSGGDAVVFQYDKDLKIIEDSLKKHYPCATKLIIDSLIKLKEYAEFVQPFTNNYKPNLIWKNAPLQWSGSSSGDYQLGQAQPDTTGIGLGTIITLNNKMLENSSQLLIAAGAIHETLHAYINFGLASAESNQRNGYMDLDSWLYGIDTWYNIHGLPSNYSNHYVMMDNFFEKAINILKKWDNNGHTQKEYVMAMMYGMDNGGDGTSPAQKTRLAAQFDSIKVKNGVIESELNTFKRSHLNADISKRLPKNGCD